MIPGPIEIEPEVLEEMGKPLLAHYGREWAQFYRQTVELMKRVMLAERARLYLIAGPGSAALDAAIGSAIADGKRILVLSNGFFGERLRQIASSYVTAEHVRVLEAPAGEAIAPERVEEDLKRDGDISVVAVVHCETSTGVLNPIREIAEICSRYEALLIVDAISSLGGAELRFDEWEIGVCVSSTQKCLALPPGLAPIAVSERAWEIIKKTERPGWYLDLRTWERYFDEWGEWHPHPVTMSSGLIRALHINLNQILAEGLEARWERHKRMARLLRRGLISLGFRTVTAEDCASPTVTAVWAHEQLPAEQLIGFLKEEHGILIAGGLSELSGRAFRIGHMGPTARPDAILPVLFGIEDALRRVGVPIPPGRSLQGLET